MQQEHSGKQLYQEKKICQKKISSRWVRHLIMIIAGVLVPMLSLAQVPSSTNYRLDTSNFDFGGGEFSSSTNFTARGSFGGVQENRTTSTSFNLFSGFFPASYPGIPAAPTLTNTGGNLYNVLDFVIATGGNRADTNYAIAVSTDNFITTNFVQADDTIGPNPAWQTYISWGAGVGQRLTGLTSSTTYKIKVKARFGPDSETGYSVVATAATVAPIFSVTVAGVLNGTTINTFTTNLATTATSVAFSSLQTGAVKVAAQTITVNTNALSGYSAALMQDHDLAKTNGTVILPVSSSNTSPAAWPSGITTARFGYHTMDSTLCTGLFNRFAVDDTFAAATSTPFEIACNTGPVSNETTNIIFKVEIEALQPSGDYKNQVTYIITPQY